MENQVYAFLKKKTTQKLMKSEPSCGHILLLLLYHTTSQSPKRCIWNQATQSRRERRSIACFIEHFFNLCLCRTEHDKELSQTVPVKATGLVVLWLQKMNLANRHRLLLAGFLLFVLGWILTGTCNYSPGCKNLNLDINAPELWSTRLWQMMEGHSVKIFILS